MSIDWSKTSNRHKYCPKCDRDVITPHLCLKEVEYIGTADINPSNNPYDFSDKPELVKEMQDQKKFYTDLIHYFLASPDVKEIIRNACCDAVDGYMKETIRKQIKREMFETPGSEITNFFESLLSPMVAYSVQAQYRGMMQDIIREKVAEEALKVLRNKEVEVKTKAIGMTEFGEEFSIQQIDNHRRIEEDEPS